MKARHHTRRPPRRVGLWGKQNESIHTLSEGPPGISWSIPALLEPGRISPAIKNHQSWQIGQLLLSCSPFQQVRQNTPFLFMFFAADDMICSCGGIQCSHTDRKKKKQSFYMMISLCLQQHHIPMFHDYIPIVFHCYPKFFPQPPTTLLLLDPELRPWQI